jgi:hypothetical protein
VRAHPNSTPASHPQLSRCAYAPVHPEYARAFRAQRCGHLVSLAAAPRQPHHHLTQLARGAASRQGVVSHETCHGRGESGSRAS